MAYTFLASRENCLKPLTLVLTMEDLGNWDSEAHQGIATAYQSLTIEVTDPSFGPQLPLQCEIVNGARSNDSPLEDLSI